MNRFLKIIYLLFLVMIVSCISRGNSTFENEVVMTKGMAISATNNLGKLSIEAGKGFERSFTWAGDTRSVKLKPRKERWNGSFGLYHPGDGSHWEEHDGITRAVIEEGHLYFSSIEDLLIYLDRYEDRDKFVYTDDGLFVYWDKRSGAGGTLSVLLWQFFINGKKPSRIPGSNSSKILVTFNQ